MKYIVLILSLMLAMPAMAAEDLSAKEPAEREVLIPEETILQLARNLAKLQILMESFNEMVQQEYRKESIRLRDEREMKKEAQ